MKNVRRYISHISFCAYSSKNGSPVEGVGEVTNHVGGGEGMPRLVATVTKAPVGGSRLKATSATTSLEIDVGNGQLISLNDPKAVAIKQLAPEQLTATMMQLQMLKDQVDSAMQQLTK